MESGSYSNSGPGFWRYPSRLHGTILGHPLVVRPESKFWARVWCCPRKWHGTSLGYRLLVRRRAARTVVLGRGWVLPEPTVKPPGVKGFCGPVGVAVGVPKAGAGPRI